MIKIQILMRIMGSGAQGPGTPHTCVDVIPLISGESKLNLLIAPCYQGSNLNPQNHLWHLTILEVAASLFKHSLEPLFQTNVISHWHCIVKYSPT